MAIRKDSKTRNTDFSGGLSASNPEISFILDIYDAISGAYIGSVEVSEEGETATGSDESKNDEDDAANGGGNSGTVRAAAGYMLALQVDLVTPEPTDAAWPKWVGHAVLGTTSAIILYSAGKSFLNPNLEETTTSRGNPSDWSFDPEIQRLENDKFINFQGGPPPKWVWPYILGAAGYELYNNWPKPRELPTQKTNDDYFIGPKPFHPNRW